MFRKIFDLIGEPKILVVAVASFATVFSAFHANDFWAFGAHYFAGAATAIALMYCVDEED